MCAVLTVSYHGLRRINTPNFNHDSSIYVEAKSNVCIIILPLIKMNFGRKVSRNYNRFNKFRLLSFVIYFLCCTDNKKISFFNSTPLYRIAGNFSIPSVPASFMEKTIRHEPLFHKWFSSCPESPACTLIAVNQCWITKKQTVCQHRVKSV